MRNPFQPLPALLALCAATVTTASDFTGAAFYEHIDFRGHELILYPGEGIPNLADEPRAPWRTWNDEISSVALWGDIVVYLYEHANYGGRVVTLIDHAPDLFYTEWGNFNDRVSSVYVDWYYSDGWMYDETLQSWTYWEDEWFYHEEGLGWLYGGYFDRTWGSGWIHDASFGWLYTDYLSYPWFYSADWGSLMFLSGTSAPRWWYQWGHGWITG